MNPEKAIKIQAKNKLGDNNWPSAVGVALTLMGVIMAIAYIVSAIDLAANTLIQSIDAESLLGTDLYEYFYPEDYTTISLSAYTLVPCVLLFIPMLIGAIRYFYLLAKDTNTNYSELFYYYHKGKFFSSIGKFIGIGVRSLWQFAVCFAPAYILYTVAQTNAYEKEILDFSDIICYFISYALLFGGILLFTKLSSKYFLTMFLYIEDENMSVSEICDRSVAYTERFRGSIMELIKSLFPWMLSCILIIPCLFVVPYVMTSLATSAKWMIALYNTEVKDE